MPQPAAVARPVIAATAVAAPVASTLAVASFHTHVSDPSRQLDLIKANVAGFTGMILLEHLTWVRIAVACVSGDSTKALRCLRPVSGLSG